MWVIIMQYKNNEVVLPGDILCTYEEYIPSKWTYVEDGYVKSSIFGRVVIDEENKTISIHADNVPKEVEIDDIVIGYVTEVKPHKAFVTVKKFLCTDRELITAYKGYIHVSKAMDGYVQSMQYLFKIGDIIAAKVINVIGSEYIELSTSEDSLGIIKAMCVECRNFMELNEDHQLICKCGKIDSRKISTYYGGLK